MTEVEEETLGLVAYGGGVSVADGFFLCFFQNGLLDGLLTIIVL